MKKSFTLFSILLTSLFSVAQGLSDSVYLGVYYINKSYYSLSQGEVQNSPNAGWDLAFEMSGMGSSIRINAQAAARLYIYPHGDDNAWNSADTAGLHNWKPLYDADYSWHIGAFEQNLQAGNPFDLGWGSYNQITHTVQGDSVYFFKTVSGKWKKLLIEGLVNGSYNFKYEDLDGSNSVNASISKANFAGKRFGYYSITAGASLDLEPKIEDWDLLFTKYMIQNPSGDYETEIVALTNTNIRVAEVDGLADPYQETAFAGLDFDTTINTIGYDWYTWLPSSGSFKVKDSLAFFLKDTASEAVYRLIMEEFGGVADGKIKFHKEQVNTVKLEDELESIQFKVYPNPANDRLNIVYDLSGKAELSIFDSKGAIMLKKQLDNQHFSEESLSLQQLKPGLYFVEVRLGNERVTEKLIVQ